jgi:hypothetical protein
MPFSCSTSNASSCTASLTVALLLLLLATVASGAVRSTSTCISGTVIAHTYNTEHHISSAAMHVCTMLVELYWCMTRHSVTPTTPLLPTLASHATAARYHIPVAHILMHIAYVSKQLTCKASHNSLSVRGWLFGNS